MGGDDVDSQAHSIKRGFNIRKGSNKLMGNNDMADFQHAATMGHGKNQHSLGDALRTKRIHNDSTLAAEQIPSLRETHSAAFPKNQVNPLV